MSCEENFLEIIPYEFIESLQQEIDEMSSIDSQNNLYKNYLYFNVIIHFFK